MAAGTLLGGSQVEKLCLDLPVGVVVGCARSWSNYKNDFDACQRYVVEKSKKRSFVDDARQRLKQLSSDCHCERVLTTLRRHRRRQQARQRSTTRLFGGHSAGVVAVDPPEVIALLRRIQLTHSKHQSAC